MIHKLPSYKACFGCGRKNPIGLKLEVYWDDERREAFSEFVLDKVYEGFEGVIHGGIVCTVCDEVLWWCIAAHYKKCTVTAEMRIKFKRPMSSNKKYRAFAKVEEVKGKRIIAACNIKDEEGNVCALAEGLFVALPDSEWDRFLSELEDAGILAAEGQ
jgi:uncharacterized protein (TIGR00369 family)